MTRPLLLMRILRLPTVLGLAALAGLILALLADGVWDYLGCLALLLPLGVAAFAAMRSRTH